MHFWGESPEGQWTLVFSDSTNVDPCQLNNQTLNLTTLNNKTDTLPKNTTLPAAANNQTNNFTEPNNNSSANASLDSIHIGNVTTSNATSTEGKAEPTDIKNLYNIINNINDISQRILKLQSNNSTAEDDATQSMTSKAVPASTKTLNNEDSETDDKIHEKDVSFSEKLRNLDDSNNNTKFYERILLEKVRVGPNSDNSFSTNSNQMHLLLFTTKFKLILKMLLRK